MVGFCKLEKSANGTRTTPCLIFGKERFLYQYYYIGAEHIAYSIIDWNIDINLKIWKNNIIQCCNQSHNYKVYPNRDINILRSKEMLNKYGVYDW